jgi:hypothetical protein
VAAFAVVLAVVLALPSVGSGLVTEEFVQRDLVRHGKYHLPGYVNLFGHEHPWSAADVAQRNYQYQLFGWFPWFTDKRFDASFWRPLSSWTHQIDYRLFPNAAALMHAENLAWYALLVFFAGLLYQRLLPRRWVAGLAAVLYAVDDAHGHAVGWITNRNGLMATAFAVIALWAYDRFRRDGWTWGAVLTPVFIALGLGSAEFALCASGYFLAHVLFVDRAPAARRLLASTTWVVVFAGWLVLYRGLGYATHGSGLYIDPLHDPAQYLSAFSERASVLVTAQLGAPPADLWTRSGPSLQGFLVLWSAVFVAGVGWVLWPLFRTNARARFFAAGLVLSLPPACATFAEDRLLLFAGLGAMPLVALVIASLFEDAPWTLERPGSSKALGVAWLGLHLVLAPLLLPYRSLHMYRYQHELDHADASLFSHVNFGANQALIVVNGRDDYFAGVLPLLRAARGLPDVGRLITLSGSLDDVEIRRLDDRRIWVRPKYGFYSRVFNRLYRGRDNPLARKSVVELAGVNVIVDDVDQWGEPTAVVFEFQYPLENPSYKWVVWHDDRYDTFVPPKVGTSVTVDHA